MFLGHYHAQLKFTFQII